MARRLRRRYGRSLKLSFSKVDAWLPESYCLDSEDDARALVVTFARKFGGSESPAYKNHLYDRLYGKPWCSDNEMDRVKIINTLLMRDHL